MVDLHVSCTMMTAVHLEVTTSEGALDILGLHRSLYYSSLPSLYLSGVMWNNKLKSTVRKLVPEIAWGSGTGGTDKKKIKMLAFISEQESSEMFSATFSSDNNQS